MTWNKVRVMGPVTIANPCGGDNSGLTDTQLRAAPVPVSGSFYQVTQPVSGTFWQATQPVSGTFWQTTQPISGTVTVSGSVAVTGSFYQPTQPVSIAATVAVSGPLTDTQLRASAVPVSGTFYPVTQPVSGTVAVTGAFWQATQPVSGTVTANINGTVPVSGTFFQATQPVSIASMPSTPVTGAFWQATQPVSVAATIATRDLKDTSRNIVNAATAIAGVTAVTTEALLTLAVSRDGAGTSNVTTIAVTSGKKLRIIGITAGVISTAAAVISARVCLRMNPSGSAAANSPILAILPMSQQAAALAQAGDSCVLMLSEAIEISGTMQVGLSHVASATTGTVWASLIGYEY